MPTNIKTSAAEEIRMRNNLAQIEQRNQAQTRELEEKHGDDLRRTIENQTFQLDNMRRAYDLTISQEAEALEERLHQTRASADERVTTEKRAEEMEIDKMKSAHKQRVDEYKKNSEQQLDTMRKQMQASSESLHEKARKSAKREREISGA